MQTVWQEKIEEELQSEHIILVQRRADTRTTSDVEN